jgi:hypothetical protein
MKMSKNKQRNYSTMHAANNHIDAVTNHEDGTCTFMLDSIPDLACRTVTVHGRKGALFSISIGHNGVAYQMLDAGQDLNLFTLWDDEV